MTPGRYWCQHALVDSQLQHGVSITIDDGRFTSVSPTGGPAPVDARRLQGLTVPGFANVHSHAFHRALRSRTQTDRGSFWTWRELMYAAANRLDPDNYHRLARATFAEMAMAGMSAVGEFHYVHHQPDGTPYDNANAMGEALLVAAAEAGIRITLLDTLYLHGGLSADGYEPLACAQRRFGDPSADAWAERVMGHATGPRQRVGAAIHSVRAVDPTSISTVVDWTTQHGAPLHAHVSEQTVENDRCQSAHSCTPTELLSTAGALGPRFTAVHATHLTGHDIELLMAAGASVCMCPTTEQDLGDGIGPSRELVQSGIAIGLGSDSHAVIDHLLEARTVELDERLR